MDIEREYDHGTVTYSVEFIFGGYEYEYEIDGATGEIMDYSKEPAGSGQQTDDQTSAAGEPIGKEAAKSIAFGHAGVQADSAVTELDIEREYDHGTVTYSVEFIFGGYEYEYEIDGATGEILDYSKEAR